jgi:predicted porin
MPESLMKSSCLLVLVLGTCAAVAHAQTNEVYRLSVPAQGGKHKIAVIDVSDLFEPGMTDTATKVFGYPGKRMGLTSAAEPVKLDGYNIDRSDRNHRAWGISVGLQGGPVTIRVARQNKNVARVAPSMPLGNTADAKNTIIAAHIDLGPMKAYTAYSANRGWGASPLWNPDNPYGAAMASTPSTDSRDVLVGLAMPISRQTTLLTSFVRKNDRDLANRDADQFAFGATYAKSRRTDYYAALSHTRMRHGGSELAGIPMLTRGGSSALNLGMRHAF